MIATKYLKIGLCLFLFFVSACAMLDPDIPEYNTSSKELLPEMEIIGVEQVYSWHAVLKLRIKGREGTKPSKIVFCYSREKELPEVASGIPLSSEYTNDTIEVRLTSLLPSTDYYCRIYVETRDEKGYSDTFQFTTLSLTSDRGWAKVCEFPEENDGFYDAVVIGQDVYIRGIVVKDNYDTGDFTIWKYTPSLNRWTKISDYPGGIRIEPVMFSIGTKLYVGLGEINKSGINYCQLDFWEYDTETEEWKRVCDFPKKDYSVMAVFSCQGKGYVSTISDRVTVFAYDPLSNTWVRMSDFPGKSVARTLVVTAYNRVFMFGGIFMGGMEPPLSNYLWEYRASDDSWFRCADFPDAGRWDPVGFIIDGNLYAGYGEISAGGNFLVTINDFWCYSMDKDTWEPRSTFSSATFPGYFTLSFQVDNIGYVGGKGTGLWSYQPEQDK